MAYSNVSTHVNHGSIFCESFIQTSRYSDYDDYLGYTFTYNSGSSPGSHVFRDGFPTYVTNWPNRATAINSTMINGYITRGKLKIGILCFWNGNGCANFTGAFSGGTYLRFLFTYTGNFESATGWDYFKYENGSIIGRCLHSYWNEDKDYTTLKILKGLTESDYLDYLDDYIIPMAVNIGLTAKRPTTITGIYLSTNGMNYYYRTKFIQTSIAETSNVVNYEACKKSRYYTGY